MLRVVQAQTDKSPITLKAIIDTCFELIKSECLRADGDENRVFLKCIEAYTVHPAPRLILYSSTLYASRWPSGPPRRDAGMSTTRLREGIAIVPYDAIEGSEETGLARLN